MRERILLASVLAAMLCAAGCETQPTEAASEGSPPAVTIPVGPVPGPGPQPQMASNPYAGNDVATSEGRQLFIRYNCYGCHGGHGGGGMGPSLRDPDWIYGNASARIFSSIAEGRAHGMPRLGNQASTGADLEAGGVYKNNGRIRRNRIRRRHFPAGPLRYQAAVR